MPAKKSKTTKKTKTSSATSTATTAAPASAGDTTSTTSTSTTAPSGAGLMALVGNLESFLSTAENQLGPEPPISTAVQKRRVAKPRKGSDKALTLIAPIVQQHRLESASLNTTDMLDRYTTAQTLTPLTTRLQKISKRVGDEAFNAQTDAWNMGLQFYSLLQRRAKTDGQLATNIEPLGKMFAYRHPSVKADHPTKVQTRVKKNLKKYTELAVKHGVAGVDSAQVAGAAAVAAGGQGAAAPVQSVPVAAVNGGAAPVVTGVATPAAPGGGAPAVQGAAPVVGAGQPAATGAAGAPSAPASAPVAGAVAAPVVAAPVNGAGPSH